MSLLQEPHYIHCIKPNDLCLNERCLLCAPKGYCLYFQEWLSLLDVSVQWWIYATRVPCRGTHTHITTCTPRPLGGVSATQVWTCASHLSAADSAFLPSPWLYIATFIILEARNKPNRKVPRSYQPGMPQNILNSINILNSPSCIDHNGKKHNWCSRNQRISKFHSADILYTTSPSTDITRMISLRLAIHAESFPVVIYCPVSCARVITSEKTAQGGVACHFRCWKL